MTATYNLDDADAVKAVKEADKLAQSTYLVYNYSRDDKAAGTRDVEKIVAEKIGVVGTLTANAAGDININAEADLPVKNITAGGNVNITATGNIVPSDKNSLVKAPNVNLTATNDIAAKSTPLTIHADLTALKSKYAYIAGDYGSLKAAGTKVIDKDNNAGSGGASGSWESALPGDKHAPLQSFGTLNTASVVNMAAPATTTTAAIAPTNKFYKVALALSQSSAVTNKSGDAYDAAAKAWLSGMGYSDAEM